MSNGKATIVLLIVGMIKKTSINEWVLSKTEIVRSKCKSWIRVSNYVRKQI